MNIQIEIRVKEKGIQWDKIKPTIHTVPSGSEYSYCKSMSEQKRCGSEI